MQRRMKDKLATQDAKYEVLRRYWDLTLFKFLGKANLMGDENMKLLVQLISKLPAAVVDEAIK